MSKKHFDYHAIIIGAGIAGITLAKGLAKAKKSVLLIEQNLFGGTCVHTGCTPSKTLLFAARKNQETALQTAALMVKEFQNEYNEIALKNLGIHCLKAKASFINANTLSCCLEKGGVRNVTGKSIVIATGSTPRTLEGSTSQETQVFTTDSLFELKALPKDLTIIGAGPIGIEMATAFMLMGTKVTVIAKSDRILPKEDVEAAYLIQKELEEKGVIFQLEKEITTLDSVEGSCVLVAIGRKPNLSSLDLESLGIFYNEKGIEVDHFGRTAKKNIFVIGDATGPNETTHMAKYEAKVILRSLLYRPFLFFLRKKKPASRVLFSILELASVGLLESEAIEKYGKSNVIALTLPLSCLPRALYENKKEGFVKIIIKKWPKKILGATAVCSHAGEIIGFIASLMHLGLPLSKVYRLITPYPTYLNIVEEIADS